jgi:hypothetical protein
MRDDDKFDAIAGGIGCVMLLLSFATSAFMLFLAYKLVMWLTSQQL